MTAGGTSVSDVQAGDPVGEFLPRDPRLAAGR